jgi:hypothetical protein
MIFICLLFFTPPQQIGFQIIKTMALQKPALKNKPPVSCCSQALVYCDVLKYIYAGMLIQLPGEKIREFWRKFPPPPLPPAFEEADLFRFLWSSEQQLPLQYVTAVYNGLEPFLEGCSVRDVDFVTTLLRQVSRGSIVPASTLLSWMKPFIKLFFVNRDIRLLLLRIFNHFTSKILKEITFRVASHESDAKWNTTTLLAMHSSVIKRRHSLKRIFSERLPPLDCELWVSMFIQMLPSCFNLPAFEERFIKADSRNIQDILRDRAIVQTKGKIFINGILYGTNTGFHAFCRKNSIDLSAFAIPDCQVVVVIKDYFCPRKKRIILHKGCAYGSPVVLFGFNYKKNIPVSPGFLSPFLDEALSFPASSWKEAKQCHEQLLETVSFKATFVYHTADGSIFLNGEHFVKNVPAKILRKMLLSHCATGQTVFFHREFAMDRSITNDPKAPNIIVRLRRLSHAFEERFPKIKITRVSRGKIAFLPSCKIEFSEI